MLLLYAVTDRSWLFKERLEEKIEQAILGGVTMVQLREKNLSTLEYIKRAKEVKKITDAYQVPLIINDEVIVAAESDAAGVHVGQADLVASKAREILGKDKIIGVSAKTIEQAIEAERNGADYLGIGAVFGTSTKLDATRVRLETVQEICQAVKIPAVAIGGINETNMLQLKGCGVSGVAVVSSLFAKENIKEAAQLLKKYSENIVQIGVRT